MKLNYNTIHIAWLCLLLSWVLSGCTLNNDLDIDEPQQVSAIIVEGYITPENSMQISVSRNNLMNDELILQSIWNAEAYITDQTDTINLLNYYQINKNRKILVNYVSDSVPESLTGNNLYLNIITVAGDTLTSKSQRVTPILISNAILEDNVITIDNEFPEGGFTGYMRMDITNYRADTVESTKTQYINLSKSAFDNIQIPVSEKMFKMDSVLVKAFHITEAYYHYAISVYNAKSAYYDPFLTPEEIKSNVANAIGIFTYYTFDSKVIRLH